MSIENPNSHVENDPKSEFMAELSEIEKSLEASPAVQALKRLDTFLERVPAEEREKFQKTVDSIKSATEKHPDVQLYYYVKTKPTFDAI